MIIHQGGLQYKELIFKYHCWNTLSMCTSFLFSFKFHIIQMSYFMNSTALSGDWNHEMWGVWHMITVTYIISCYTIMMGSSAYFVLTSMSRTDEWIFWATVDVAGLSTVITILLLIVSCTNCKENPKLVTNDPFKAYNRLEDTKNSSGLVSEMIKKLPPLPPLPRPIIKPLDRSVASRRNLNDTRGFDNKSMLSDDPPLSKRNIAPPASNRRKDTNISPMSRKQTEHDPFPPGPKWKDGANLFHQHPSPISITIP